MSHSVPVDLIVNESYCAFNTCVVAPLIVSEPLPSIVTTLAVASFLMMIRVRPGRLMAGGSVMVNVPPLASQTMNAPDEIVPVALKNLTCDMMAVSTMFWTVIVVV